MCVVVRSVHAFYWICTMFICKSVGQQYSMVVGMYPSHTGFLAVFSVAGCLCRSVFWGGGKL